jgi:hypothetical protein
MDESDEQFLQGVVDELERLRGESRERGHPFLASIIDLAVVEAQDDLRTQAITVRRLSDFREPDLLGVNVG